MKQTLTSKESKFCEMIAKGKSQVDSYKIAYECENSNKDTIKSNANKLMNKANIKARLAELKEIQEKDCKYTKEQSYKNLCEIQKQALQENNLNAYIRAEELKGKLFDLYNNKTDINLKGNINHTITALKEYKIIYTIDTGILKDLIKGNEENELLKLLVADLKRTDTALLTAEQYKKIKEETNSNYITIPFDIKCRNL